MRWHRIEGSRPRGVVLDDTSKYVRDLVQRAPQVKADRR
jgi:hypothetical protein